jgi:hypothetical protein
MNLDIKDNMNSGSDPKNASCVGDICNRVASDTLVQGMVKKRKAILAKNGTLRAGAGSKLKAQQEPRPTPCVRPGSADQPTAHKKP